MKLFNRSYETIGKETADFCIVTRGQLKVKWGNKFIDIIKDGKLNVGLDYKIINRVKDYDSINSNKDGIYVTDSNKVYIVSNGIIIPVIEESENSEYVSYLKQDKDGESKSVAQSNIGLYFNSKKDLEDSGINNGISYIIDENMLYMIKNGELIPLKMKLSNPFTEPLEIRLANSSSYALFLNGHFSVNGTRLMIGTDENNISIYSEANCSYIDSISKLCIRVNNKDVFDITDTAIEIGNFDLIVKNNKVIKCDIFSSINGSKTKDLYIEKGDIYCDNIYVRNKIKFGQSVTYEELKKLVDNEELSISSIYYLTDYQDPFNIVNVYNEDEYANPDEENPTLVNKKNVFEIELNTDNEGHLIKEGYIEYLNCNVVYDVMYNEIVCSVEGYEVKAKGVIERMTDEYGNSAPFNFKNKKFFINNKWKYAFGGDIDESSSGKFTNITIEGKYLDFKHEQMPYGDMQVEDLASDGDGVICIESDNDVDNIYISGIKGEFIVNSTNFKRNKINSDNISNTRILSEFFDNNITSSIFKNVTISSKFSNNEIISNSVLMFKSLSDVEYNNIRSLNIKSINISGNAKLNNIIAETIEDLKISKPFSRNSIAVKSIIADIKGDFENSNIECNNVKLFKCSGSINSSSFIGDTIESFDITGNISSSSIRFKSAKISVTGDILLSDIYADTFSEATLKSISSSNILINSINKSTIDNITVSNLNIKLIQNSTIKNVLNLDIDIDEMGDSTIDVANNSYFNSGTISQSTFKNIKRSKIKGDITSCSFNGMTNIEITDGMDSMTFDKELVSVCFNSKLSNDVLNDSIKNYEYLFSDKYSNVFKDSKGIHIIYIPELTASFYGQIVMFSGTVDKIPEGWHICDGSNGTPNLIDKFILASNVAGNEGGSNKLKEENIPKHSHNLIYSSSSSGTMRSEIFSKNNGDIIDCRGEVPSIGNDRAAQINAKYAQVLLYSNEFEAPVTGYPTNYKVNIRWQAESDGGESNKFWKRDNSGFVDVSEFARVVMSQIKIDNSAVYEPEEFMPKYYSLIFIMYTGE